jgi:hypothetical protein
MITPIEMYTMVPKSQEVSTLHSQANARTDAQHHNVVQQIADEVRHNDQQVVHMTSAENPEYRYDAKEQGNGSYSEQNKKKKKKENESETGENGTNASGHSGFDIRI